MRALKNFFENVPFHVIIFPVGIVLDHFFANQHRLTVSEIIPVTLAFMFGAALLALLLKQVMGTLLKGALATTLIIFFTYNIALIIALTGLIPPAQIILLLTLGALLLLWLAYMRRAVGTYRDMTLILNIMVLIQLALPLAHIIPYQQQIAHRPSSRELFPDLPAAKVTGDTPDIWHFVFDRYASLETLSHVYKYDNRAFMNVLEKRGFSVARNASANYQRTAPSVVSTLNLDYLNPLTERIGAESSDLVPLYALLTDSRAARFLTGAGYRYYHLGSWWNPTRQNALATMNLNFRDLPESARSLIDNSIFGRLAAMDAMPLPYANARRDQCGRIHYQFEMLNHLTKRDERKYIFAHILLPHPPFVVDAKGNCQSIAQTMKKSRRDNYIDQLTYANQQILALMDAILAGPRPAIIILQSDEGPWPEKYAGDERFIGRDAPATDWTKPTREELREKIQILYAVHTPDKSWAVSPHETPINTYRHILNNYFGFHLAMLPQRNFVFQDDTHLYTFDEVTDKLQ